MSAKPAFKPSRPSAAAAASKSDKEKPVSAKKLTALEKRIHELALSLDEQILTQDSLLAGLDASSVTTEINEAMNALVRKRLLKLLQLDGDMLWKAVESKQLDSCVPTISVFGP